jgi:hypothetical protein
MKQSVLFPAAIALLAAGACLAGVQIESVDESLTDGKATNQTVRIDNDRMMVDMQGDRGRQTVLFLGADQLFRMIDHEKKNYREMTQQDMEQIGSQLNDAMSKLQEQMKNMPPAQRQMMEKMMKGKMGQMMDQTAEKTVYTAAGAGKAGQWDCARYDGTRGGEKVSEVCAVEFGEFGLRASDFAVMQKMAEFFTKIMPGGMKDNFMVGSEKWQEEQGFPGVPVLRTTFNGGKAEQRTTVKSVTRAEFENALFEVPAGYNKEAMPRMGGR